MAKWIEGACYFLHSHPDKALSNHVQHLVDLIESAQQPDGYLNIHFVVNEPEKRWSNLRDLHELYNGGHLIEAALAHHRLTGSNQFLKVMLSFVHYCATVFGPASKGLKPGYPGHPEIELALFRLYERTGDSTAYDLGRFFLMERGANGGQYYIEEQAKRGEHPELAPAMMPKKHSFWYMQAHAPIVEQQEIMGHSVRAMYLLTAVADLVDLQHASIPDGSLQASEARDFDRALHRLWNNMVQSKMYITGGIGSIKQWEGFSIPYSLPQATDEGGCYAETCAAIGIVMVAERMLSMKLDGAIADVAERALYNASITCGMSADGRSFTYENQLASSPQDPCVRHEWFQCACCPPNVLRTLGILGGFFWSPAREGGLAIHHYFDGSFEHDGTSVQIQTKYPWSGRVELSINSTAQDRPVWLRIPAWAHKDFTLSSRKPSDSNLHSGYLRLGSGEHVLDLHLKPRLTFSHPYTGQDTVTMLYGPLVYCVEDVDHPWEKNHFKDLCLPGDMDLSTVKAETRDDDVTYLHVPKAGYHLRVSPDAMANETSGKTEYVEDEGRGKDLTFIPYYYRANRKTDGVQVRTSLRVKR